MSETHDGWTAVARDPAVLLNGKHKPAPVLVEDLQWPEDEVVALIKDYARAELREETFNHSMRVYYFGLTILKQQFPAHNVSPATYALTALLHDIGTTDKNLHATQMSFEFYGGMLALAQLEKVGSTKSQSEAVTEAIIRHQDLGQTGKITLLGQVTQLATVYDNMGGNAELIHPKTQEDVCRAFPRKGWSSCFASTIIEENTLKPWAHTTALGEEAFPQGVAGNQLMEKYDKDGL